MVVIGGYYTNETKRDCDSPGSLGQHDLMLGQGLSEKKFEGREWHALRSNVTDY